MVERIPSGVLGLDQCIDGGFLPNTSIAVLGAPGTGKTTIALQFLSKSVEEDVGAIYVSLEESQENIIKNAKLLNFNWIESGITFVKANARDFHEHIYELLIDEVTKWKEINDSEEPLRIAVDPISPILWKSDEAVKKREKIADLLKMLTSVGTVLLVTEEDSSNPLGAFDSTLIKYLVDSVIDLRFVGQGKQYDHLLRILKMRGTDHERESFPIHFLKGLGIVLQLRDKTKKKVKGEPIPDHLIKKLENVANNLSEKQRKILTERLSPLYSGREELPHLLPPEMIIDNLIEEYSRDQKEVEKKSLPFKQKSMWK